MKQVTFHFIFTALFLVTLAASCGGGQQAAPGAGAPPPPATYSVFTVTPQTATLNTDYPATLQGEQNIEIRPKVDGFVIKFT